MDEDNDEDCNEEEVALFIVLSQNCGEHPLDENPCENCPHHVVTVLSSSLDISENVFIIPCRCWTVFDEHEKNRDKESEGNQSES